MADIVKDSFVESNRFQKVIFQRGRDVCDFELNEFQDIIRVNQLRALFNGIQNAAGTALNPGTNDLGFKVVGTGATNSVTIKAGFLLCDGIVITNAADFAQGGFATPGSNRTDTVYLAITEVEVNDPAQVPQLGETTKRRQIQITVSISITGHAGVPSNSVAEIWQGGVHYFMIADIARHSGSGVISSGDVTDLRFLLPPSIISAITRQANGAVAAVVANNIETGSGVGMPTSNLMTFDSDVTDAFTPSGFKWRVRKNTVNSRILMELVDGQGSQLNDAYTGALLLFNNVVLEAQPTLSFADDNTKAVIAPDLKQVDLSENEFGAENLRVVETLNNPTVRRTSILRALNSRHLTVGDGSNSFGEFNGATAISDAAHHALVVLGLTGVTIFVKPGTYSESGTNLNFTGKSLSLVGLGAKQTDTTLTVSADGVFVMNGGSLRVENMLVQNAGAGGATIKVIQASDKCILRRVSMSGALVWDTCTQDLVCEDMVMTSQAFTSKPCIQIQVSTGTPATTANLGNCYFTRVKGRPSPTHASPIIITVTGNIDGLNVWGDIVFTDCEWKCGTTTNAGSGTMTANCGVVDVYSGILANPNKFGYRSLRFIRTNVRANAFGDPGMGGSYGAASCLLRLGTSNVNSVGTPDTVLLGELEIEGGNWTVPDLDTFHSPFTILIANYATGPFPYPPSKKISIRQTRFLWDSVANNRQMGGFPNDLSQYVTTDPYMAVTSKDRSWGWFNIIHTLSNDFPVELKNIELSGGNFSTVGDMLITTNSPLDIDGVVVTGTGATDPGSGTAPYQRVRFTTLSSGAAPSALPCYVRRLNLRAWGGAANMVNGGITVLCNAGIRIDIGTYDSGFFLEKCVLLGDTTQTNGIVMPFVPASPTNSWWHNIHINQNTIDQVGTCGFLNNCPNTIGSAGTSFLKNISLNGNRWIACISGQQISHLIEGILLYGIQIHENFSGGGSGISAWLLSSPEIGTDNQRGLSICNNDLPDFASHVVGISVLGTNTTLGFGPNMALYGNTVGKGTAPGDIKIQKDASAGATALTTPALASTTSARGAETGVDADGNRFRFTNASIMWHNSAFLQTP